MAELMDVVNAMLRKRNDWVNITDEEKIKNFFIINRYLSKKYTDKAQLFNDKSINKVLAMDIWFYFMQSQPYPKFLFSKSKTKDKPLIVNKDYKLLLTKLKIKTDDLDYLIDKHYDFIKEELSFYKKVEKGN